MIFALRSPKSCSVPPTFQTVCKLVTSNSQSAVFCSLSFQSLAHSLVRAHSATPLQSYCSALFAKNTGGGYPPQNLPRVFKGLRTFTPLAPSRLYEGSGLCKELFRLPIKSRLAPPAPILSGTRSGSAPEGSARQGRPSLFMDHGSRVTHNTGHLFLCLHEPSFRVIPSLFSPRRGNGLPGRRITATAPRVKKNTPKILTFAFCSPIVRGGRGNGKRSAAPLSSGLSRAAGRGKFRAVSGVRG